MQQRPTISLWQIFTVFLRLGLTSFGGPMAHLAFFRNECVQKRRWLTEQQYAGVVALCQFLPGPASSQAGMAIGYTLRGYRGALLSW
ncbi:MAG TPA: chromate transporter, partial [Rheinheimera sp.]|nr:chromate transporter [Rheinheimera sp.]